MAADHIEKRENFIGANILPAGICRGRATITFRAACRLNLTLVRGYMCRNVKTLYNFEPPATDDEIRASALQFVRKLSGFNTPSKIIEVAFNRSVAQLNDAATLLIASLITLSPPKDRGI